MASGAPSLTAYGNGTWFSCDDLPTTRVNACYVSVYMTWTESGGRPPFFQKVFIWRRDSPLGRASPIVRGQDFTSCLHGKSQPSYPA